MTMMTTVEIDYYVWLTQKIDIPNGKRYLDLFERMHNTEFVWTVANDDNRLQDGLDLRGEFLDTSGGEMDLGGATVLEVLIALSRRLAFVASGNRHPRHWAWTLLKNLGLQRYADPLTSRDIDRVDSIIHDLIWRNYHADGRGGFFPLTNPDTDQRKVEIWYQLNAYVAEMTDL